MKSKITTIILAILFLNFSDKPAYQLFDSAGKKLRYADMLQKISEADVVLFGELHNNSISHWLEFELLQDLHKIKQSDLVIGAEMFEADNQLIINEYLSGFYSSKKFESEMKLWNNYKTDYKPLMEFARKNKLEFIATNIPRRYANMVFKGGFKSLKSLSKQALKYIAKLPIKFDPELKCYKNMMTMGNQMGGHSNMNFPKAQAIKDATMAEFIIKNSSKDKLFLHFEGAYHSDNYQGIVWYLKQQKPKLKIVTISTKEQTMLDKLDNKYKNVANYIIAVNSNVSKTY